MAEVFGVAASALSLLAVVEQVIKTIDKMRALRTFIKTLPEQLQEYIEEIETIQGVLAMLEPEVLGAVDIPVAERRLRRFQQDLDTVASTINKYQMTATNHRLGSLRLLSKKSTLDKLKRNLESVKSTVHLIQQAYSIVYLRQLNKTGPNPTEPEETSLSVAPYAPDRKRLKKRSQNYCEDQKDFRFRTPLWLVDKIWDISMRRSFSGWTFGYKVHNVIPGDSPIFKLCFHGDIRGIQELFANRLASPFDCSSDGYSLLHFAAFKGQVQACRMLLDNGADPSQVSNIGLPVVYMADIGVARKRWRKNSELDSSVVDIYRLFLDECANELLDSKYGFGGPLEALILIQGYSFEHYSSLPLEYRFRRASSLACYDTYGINTWITRTTPSVLRMLLGGDHIDPAAYFLEAEGTGKSLFTVIIQFMALELSSQNPNRLTEWRQLLSDAVAHGADLCHISSQDRTPLLHFIYSFTDDWTMIRRADYDFGLILRIWATELQIAGVDLLEYGAREKALHDSGEILMGTRMYYGPLRSPSDDFLIYGDKGEGFRVRFLSLKYGPTPDDWHIWSTNPVDNLVGDFWEMIDRQEEPMPGAWVD